MRLPDSSLPAARVPLLYFTKNGHSRKQGTDVSVLGAHSSLYPRSASCAPCGQSRLSPSYFTKNGHFHTQWR
jgi:hypothetical protein